MIIKNITGNYTLTSIKAVPYELPEEVQDAILIHNNNEEFEDGDCILFGYGISEFESDYDVETALINECCATYSRIEDGIYYSN